jgi:hypothetical protein
VVGRREYNNVRGNRGKSIKIVKVLFTQLFGGINLRSFGLAFLIIGIFLVSLSGLEKIIIYSSLSQRASDIQTLKYITPKGIWNITQMTFIFGIIILIIGLIMSLLKIIIKEIENIRKAGRQYQEQYERRSNNDYE